MEKIEKIWFADNRIFMMTSEGKEKSRPLEAFPRLMRATEKERHNYIIWAEGQSLRWDDIDEDIHISSFDEISEPDYTNEVASLIHKSGVKDVDGFAEMIGINKWKFDLFRYGIWKPSTETIQKIKEALLKMGSHVAVL